MPVVYKGRLIYLDMDKTPLTKMSNKELIDYEKFLWRWMDSPYVATVISAIHWELKWRAEDSGFKQGR